MQLHPIGAIHTPHATPDGVPIQGARSDVEGTIEILPEYEDALSDLDGFSHLILIYWFDRSKPAQMKVVPYLDTQPRGLFATRAPTRPNPIGLTVVRLKARNGCTIHFIGADMLDGTPLLDIKPYIPDIDSNPDAKTGWLGNKFTLPPTVSDDRFSNRDPR